MLFSPPLRVVPESLEADVRRIPEVLDQLLEHTHPVSSARDLRMHRQVVDPTRTVVDHVVEVALPDLSDSRGRIQTHVCPWHIFIWREVVKTPCDGNLDELRCLAEDVGLGSRPAISTAQIVRVEIASHTARVVDEPELDQ